MTGLRHGTKPTGFEGSMRIPPSPLLSGARSTCTYAQEWAAHGFDPTGSGDLAVPFGKWFGKHCDVELPAPMTTGEEL